MTYKNSKPIAILLAVYNGEPYLRSQLDSIISQTNQEWTLYVRNDGSTDNTEKILVEYSVQNKNIIVFDDNDGNLGCRGNFFKLLENVESRYYMFSDADDVWFPTKVEDCLNLLFEKEKQYHNTPVLVHCDSTVCDKDLNVITESYWKSSHINPDKFSSFNYLAVCCAVGGANSIFNEYAKQCVYPLVENDFIYDYWIALNVSKKGKIFALHKPLKFYRQHESNVCGVTVGTERSLRYKMKNLRALWKEYIKNAEQLKTIGYGSTMKYLWYKTLVIIKSRFL